MRINMRNILVFLLCVIIVIGMLAIAAYADGSVSRINVYFSPTYPVALTDVSYVKPATGTPGCTLVGSAWYDTAGNQVTGQFEFQTYKAVVTVAIDADKLVSPDLVGYINGNPASVAYDEASRTVSLSMMIDAVAWAPSVVKHPTDETVTPGQHAVFVSNATQALDQSWFFISPQGERIAAADITAKFANVTVKTEANGYFFVYNVPAGMDGWRVICMFTGIQSTSDSNAAYIRVKPDPNATPEPTPEPVIEKEYITLGPGMPYQSDGNSHTLDMLYSAATNKQFITLQTKSGNTFYLVIDYDKPIDEDAELYETYFMNLVDERDLLSLMSDEEVEAYEAEPDPTPTPQIVYVTPEPTVAPEPVATDPEPEKTDNSKMTGIIALVAILAIGGIAVFLFTKKKKGSGG